MASRETLGVEPPWLLMTMPFNPKIHVHRKVSTVLEGLRAARLHPQPEPRQPGIPNLIPRAPEPRRYRPHRRSAISAADEIPAHDQSQDRQSSWARTACDVACSRRRGDRIVGRLAAVHESFDGTFATCRRTSKMSAYRGRPEVIGRMAKRRF